MSENSHYNHILAYGAFALAALSPVRAADSSPLAGQWKFDAEHSTQLSPWRDYSLTITVDGNVVTLDRKLGAGRRGFADKTTIDVSKDKNVIPVEMWPDNRHIGATIGGDHTKTIHAQWLDGGRILRLSTDLVLSTQQGERAVNILRDYKVSGNGTRLTLTELRSTRNRPIVYSFNRAD